MNENIIVAIITATVTLIGGYLATRQQRQKDLFDSRIETQRLKYQIESDLWERVNSQIDKEMQKRIVLENRVYDLEREGDKKDAIVESLSKRVDELEAKLKTERTARVNVERENVRLKREIHELKKDMK